MCGTLSRSLSSLFSSQHSGMFYTASNLARQRALSYQLSDSDRLRLNADRFFATGYQPSAISSYFGDPGGQAPASPVPVPMSDRPMSDGDSRRWAGRQSPPCGLAGCHFEHSAIWKRVCRLRREGGFYLWMMGSRLNATLIRGAFPLYGATAWYCQPGNMTHWPLVGVNEMVLPASCSSGIE